MNAKQFRQAVMKLGLHTQADIVKGLGISRRSVNRYTVDRYETEVPETTRRLIEAYTKDGGVPAKYR